MSIPDKRLMVFLGLGANSELMPKFFGTLNIMNSFSLKAFLPSYTYIDCHFDIFVTILSNLSFFHFASFPYGLTSPRQKWTNTSPFTLSDK